MSSRADEAHWAVSEFADGELGDVRRTKRLLEIAGVLAQHPPPPAEAVAMTRSKRLSLCEEIEARVLDSISRRHSAACTTSRWCWRCKIRPKSTDKHRDSGGPRHRPVRACMCIARWRSRLSACSRGCWPTGGARDPADGQAHRRKSAHQQKESRNGSRAEAGQAQDSVQHRLSVWRPGSRCLRPAGDGTS